ncbi:MAG: YggT family protein [Desulfobaccales bacterium]
MFAVRHLLEAVVEILNLGLTIYMWLIVARAILSWVSPDPYNPIVRFLYNATEPVLGWVRRRVPIVFGGLDLSPILVLLAIVFLQKFLVASLLELAFRIH